MNDNATVEEVNEVMTDLASKAQELDRVAGYIGDEAREISRAAGLYQSMNVPQAILDQVREAVVRLDEANRQAHSLWQDGVSARYLLQ